MVKDGLIQPSEKNNVTIDINSKEMLINGKKQTESVHQKYMQLISGKRKKAFGDKEQWSIKE